MDTLLTTNLLADSPPWVLVAYLVFLLLTRALSRLNRRSRKNDATGHHARPHEPTAETETDPEKVAGPV